MGKRQDIPWNSTIPLSKSGVQMYDRCPYRFKRQVIDGVRATSPEMERGKNIHDLVARSFLEIDYDGVMDGQIKEELYHFFKENAPDDYFEPLVKFIKLEEAKFNALEHKELIFPIYTEKFLYDSKLNFYGTFDSVEGQDDNSYIVIDWKSGKFHEWNARNYRFEMMGYKHLIETCLGLRVKEVVIFFMGTGEFFGPEVPHPSTVAAFQQRVKRTRNRIKKDLIVGEFARKRQSCQWCPLEEGCTVLSANQVTGDKVPRNARGRMK